MKSLLSPKTARRIGELEHVLDLAPGHGIMESLADDFIWSLLREPTMMLDGWDFTDRKTAEANIRCVVDRWTSENALERAQKAAATANRQKNRKGKEST